MVNNNTMYSYVYRVDSLTNLVAFKIKSKHYEITAALFCQFGSLRLLSGRFGV